MSGDTHAELYDLLAPKGIIAVLEIDDPGDAVPLCRALVAGGISAIELALRTEAAEPSIERIARDVPEMTIGIGTIIKSGQAQRVKKLGAAFGLAPGFNPAIAAEAKQANLPFIPGIVTPSELEAALEAGASILKFFPAEPSGGASYLKSLNNPYNYLKLSYIPLGGVSEENIGQYANIPQVLGIGGTWIAQRPLIRAKQWDEISRRAKRAIAIWQAYRGTK
ncbi:khg/kdpg aldolase [Treponema primitia ZAS-2]|uniref:Khg/kdpg aldolase n=1 Tax=Treponema primitia (strain ATCC BAA-887 / DSM 12427 / ZAS-2) TaxID=545694 RepID=F5YNJ2_TREPZ|nr:bifunctional 4-hydroxy-2-oxoglutarate aldolase/2-dehydro-3-deoxy-phosphogluconate aldolase [Treponema primitia]AEF85863.1 khg/kdpg aldolase [Treponema primitia ZAS-2]